MKSLKSIIALTVGKATKLGLDYNPLKNEFTALVKNIEFDEETDFYEGEIKYQGKSLIVSSQDQEYWFIEKLK